MRLDDVALQLILGALQLCLLNGHLFETAQLGDGEPNDLAGLLDGGSGVDAERAGVAEGAGLRVDGVGQTALLADGLEEARTHASAQHGVQQIDPVARGRIDRRRGHSHAELDLLQ